MESVAYREQSDQIIYCSAFHIYNTHLHYLASHSVFFFSLFTKLQIIMFDLIKKINFKSYI